MCELPTFTERFARGFEANGPTAEKMLLRLKATL
jgi:hypothetical protein